MAVNVDYSGRVYPPGPTFAVGRESIREFALAVGAVSPLHHDVAAARAAGYADVVAPPTYAVVIAQRCEAQYVADPDAGIDFSRVVHAEEQFGYHRPIVAGQEITGTLHVERVREVGGHAMITTRVDLTESSGSAADYGDGGDDASRAAARMIGWVTSTLVVRGDDA